MCINPSFAGCSKGILQHGCTGGYQPFSHWRQTLIGGMCWAVYLDVIIGEVRPFSKFSKSSSNLVI